MILPKIGIDIVGSPGIYSLGKALAQLLDGGNQRPSRNGCLSKLWRYQCRVKVIEEEALYEGLSASYSDLVEDVGEMILYGVFGDVKGCGYLLS
jgi:hypothetical protein